MPTTKHNPTPFRKTHVKFDITTVKTVDEPVCGYSRQASAMFREGNLEHNHLLYLNNGWTLKPYFDNQSIIVERSETVNPLLTSNGKLLVADGFVEKYKYRSILSAEAPNATDGASSSLSTQGYPMIQKAPSASVSDWSTLRLVADETAYPYPSTDGNPYMIDNTIKCDRVAVSVDNDSSERTVLFTWQTYGNSLANTHLPFRFYFCGPAGVTINSDTLGSGNKVGSGRYCLILQNSNIWVLFEKCSVTTDGDTQVEWVQRFKFTTPFLSGSETMHTLTVSKSRNCLVGSDGSGWIEFKFLGVHAGQTVGSAVSALADLAQGALTNSIHPIRVKYVVPLQGTTTRPPTTDEKIRLDMRRDLLGHFRIEYATYSTETVEARDSDFSLGIIPTASRDIELYYDVCTPGSSSAEAKLYRADTGEELTLVSSGSHSKVYNTPSGVSQYFVRIFLTSDGNYAPSFRSWLVQRDGVNSTPIHTQWEVGDSTHPKSIIRQVDIKGAERDLSHESADVIIFDPLNNLVELKTRAGMLGQIETEWDPTDSTKRCVLFKGVMHRAEFYRHKTGARDVPVVGWGNYHTHWRGMWQLLDENFVNTTQFAYNPESYEPYLVTDLIKAFISRSGFDTATDFDFPAISTRMAVSPRDYTQYIDMLDKVSDIVKSLARDYLQHFLIYDPNKGTSGQWRLIPVPVTPYNVVARFVTTPVGNVNGPGPVLTSYLPSYDIMGVPTAPIKSGTMQTFVKPPEANWLMVASVGIFNSGNPSLSLTEPLINYASYNVNGELTADPSSPDYLGRRVPLYVIDPALESSANPSEVISALARRLYKLVCHGIKMMTFEAPLILIPHESDSSRRRPLRYYDPVYINDETFLIRNVNPSYTKDGIQYAMYELEAPRY